MGATTVELPAGLLDPGESAEAAALRELREETGFVGRVARVSPLLCMSPGLCDEQVRLVVVEVDLDDPANAAPQQCLDDGEFIRVTRCPLPDLLGTLQRLEREGAVPIMGLYTLAVGLSLEHG